MTMQDITGLQIQEVVPGSADDPFTARPDGSSSTQEVASPAAPGDEGALKVVQGDGLQVQPPAPEANPSPTPVTSTEGQAAPAPVTFASLEEAIKALKIDEIVAGQVEERIGSALRSQQSSYDKRINALQDDLKAAREAAMRAEREGKLENLDPEEQEILKNKWALEDRKIELDNYETELDAFFRTMYIAKLVEKAAPYGVTEAELEAISEPEDMDALVASKELEYYRSGKHLETPPPVTPPATGAAVTPPAPVEQGVPAGAVAPTDLGGGAPAAPPIQLSQETGLDAMVENLKKTPWETLRIPN